MQNNEWRTFFFHLKESQSMKSTLFNWNLIFLFFVVLLRNSFAKYGRFPNTKKKPVPSLKSKARALHRGEKGKRASLALNQIILSLKAFFRNCHDFLLSPSPPPSSVHWEKCYCSAKLSNIKRSKQYVYTQILCVEIEILEAIFFFLFSLHSHLFECQQNKLLLTWFSCCDALWNFVSLSSSLACSLRFIKIVYLVITWVHDFEVKVIKFSSWKPFINLCASLWKKNENKNQNRIVYRTKEVKANHQVFWIYSLLFDSLSAGYITSTSYVFQWEERFLLWN